jgi:hypothetical protein
MSQNDVAEKLEKYLRDTGMLYIKNSNDSSKINFDESIEVPIWAAASWTAMIPPQGTEDVLKYNIYLVDCPVVDRPGYVSISMQGFLTSMSVSKMSYSLVVFHVNGEFYIKQASMINAYAKKVSAEENIDLKTRGNKRLTFMRIDPLFKPKSSSKEDEQLLELRKEQSNKFYIGSHLIDGKHSYILEIDEFVKYFKKLDFQYDEQTILLTKIFAKI